MNQGLPSTEAFVAVYRARVQMQNKVKPPIERFEIDGIVYDPAHQSGCGSVPHISPADVPKWDDDVCVCGTGFVCTVAHR